MCYLDHTPTHLLRHLSINMLQQFTSCVTVGVLRMMFCHVTFWNCCRWAEPHASHVATSRNICSARMAAVGAGTAARLFTHIQRCAHSKGSHSHAAHLPRITRSLHAPAGQEAAMGCSKPRSAKHAGPHPRHGSPDTSAQKSFGGRDAQRGVPRFPNTSPGAASSGNFHLSHPSATPNKISVVGSHMGRQLSSQISEAKDWSTLQRIWVEGRGTLNTLNMLALLRRLALVG